MNLAWEHAQAAAEGRPLPSTVFRQSDEFATEAIALQHLQGALPDSQLRSCAIESVRYEPGRRFEVVYGLATRGDGDRVVTVRFCGRGESSACFEAARCDAGQHSECIVHLTAWDAIAWVFPHDSGLPQLSDLLERGRPARGLIPKSMGGGSSGMRDWRLLSYLPGRRCALHVRLANETGSIVAKIGKGAADRHARLDALYRSPHRRFAMPEPVDFDTDRDIRWEAFVEGTRFGDALRRGDARNAMRVTSAALVALHAMPGDGLPDRGPSRVLARLQRKVLPRVEIALPHLSRRASVLADDLARRLETLPGRPMCTIHGDLHTANLLMRHGEAVLIDLDDMACGDPAYDLALLGSRLVLEGLLSREQPTEVANLVAALPSVYEAQGGAPIPGEVFAWYMATLLVSRQIKTCIRHLAPDLLVLAETLLDLAQRTLARGRFAASAVVEFRNGG